MRRMIASILHTFRRGGVQGLIEIARATARHEASLVRWRLDLAHWSPSGPLPDALDVRRGTIDELSQFRRTWRGEPLTAEFLTDRIDGTKWFYLGRWDGAVAHILWIYEPGTRTPLLTLGPGEVEIRRVYTMRAHRGRRIFTHALNVVLADLRDAGVEVAWAHVRVDNDASARAFAAAGFVPVGTVRYTKLLGVTRARFRREVPARYRASDISETISR